MSAAMLRRPSTLAALLALGAIFIGAPQVSAQDRTTEAGEAAISDPTEECTPYGYQPVTNAIPSFPTILQIADLVPGDTAAAAKWAAIQPNIPNIAPKGIATDGSLAGVTYPASDPDCWWSWTKCTTPKAPGLAPDTSVVPEPQTLGIGFDDGPSCGHNVFYNYLASQNQKATMFYIGSNVMNFPLEAQRAIVDGHEICAHTWSHKYMTSLPSQNAFAELYYSIQAIKLVTGVTPTCWRPPYGDIDDRIRAIATGLGLRSILWTYNSNDWQFGSNPNITSADVDANYQQLITDAGSGKFSSAGTIILTHELNNFTMSEAIKFYPALKTAFKNLVPVGVAMNITHPYAETTYTLPSFAQYAAGTTAAGPNTVQPGAIPSLTPGAATPPASGTTGGNTPASSGTALHAGTTTSSSSSTPSAKSGASTLLISGGGSVTGLALWFAGALAMLVL